MNALLDTCVLLWWLGEPYRLTATVRDLFEDPAAVLHWSAASSWEVALKASRRGFRLPASPRQFVRQALEEEGIVPLPIEDRHALHVVDLPQHHRDHFDRLLVAQARIEGFTLVTSDLALRPYDVEILW